MSCRGDYLDNLPIATVFRSLKSEWLSKGNYGDFNHAERDINQWINSYNSVYRPHTNLHEEKWMQVIPAS